MAQGCGVDRPAPASNIARRHASTSMVNSRSSSSMPGVSDMRSQGCVESTIRRIAYRDRMQPGTCIHFRGGQHDTCGAGVDLISVRDTSIRPYRWPCSDFGEGPAATTCERYLEPTAEQVATSKAEMDAAIALMDTRTKRGECCECSEPMADVRQVGACIYAAPCGCLVAQLPAWRAFVVFRARVRPNDPAPIASQPTARARPRAARRGADRV